MQLWDTTGHPVAGSPGSIRLPTKLPCPSAAERKTQTLNLTRHQELFLLRHLTGSVSSLHLISPQPAPCLNYIHLLRTSRGTLQISRVTPVTRIKDTHSTAAPPVSWHTPPRCTPGTLTTSQLNLCFPFCLFYLAFSLAQSRKDISTSFSRLRQNFIPGLLCQGRLFPPVPVLMSYGQKVPQNTNIKGALNASLNAQQRWEGSSPVLNMVLSPLAALSNHVFVKTKHFAS